ncbi:lysine--tRNA ligase [Candidatus Shikimatogenerans silvanidophilus]|uniref:lysine--tRNA ligase n=1 Tax=Candidatus Shikimatogenerans silvanidophilus TaxID=2782547 RepID=UPI001BAA2D36|nr:lysine--tRNA ligase [Candidatus Shikimatogenerans silvanidophilus]
MNSKKDSQQEKIRIEKLKKLKKIGINPYPSEKYYISSSIKKILNNYKKKKNVSIAGRIMSIRIMGKASFLEIEDYSDIIQIYINKNYIDDKKYNIVLKKLIDIGDFIGIKGFLFKTKTKKITINAENFTLLSKSLKPIPNVKLDKYGISHDVFSDTEQRYRMRYIDLIVNKNVKNVFISRTNIINYIRNFLNKKEYLEVETPILQNIPGGAIAKPFKTYHNSLNIPLYLRTSNELYLKKLIVGGFKGVYEFAKDFRNEGMDRIHNPEFTILELYVSYKDYYWMMDFTENLLEYICLKEKKNIKFNYFNKKISFKKPYPKISIYESIKKYTGFDIENINKISLIEICKKLNITILNYNKGKIIDDIFDKYCSKYYIQPTFIIDHPVEMNPLSKRHRKNTNITERFELIINGKEIANAYSELNDPIDQLNRFKKQNKKNINEEELIDYDFINSLKIGMPPTAGIGFGIDRLIMLLTNQKSIQDVLFFPQMKNK